MSLGVCALIAFDSFCKTGGIIVNMRSRESRTVPFFRDNRLKYDTLASTFDIFSPSETS
jgi:hypothetical protein